MSGVEHQKPRTTMHGCLFFVSLMVVIGGFPSLSWPWHLVLPLLIYGGIVLAIGPLRRTVPRLAIGRLGGRPLVFAAILALVTTSSLLGFQMQMRPNVKELVEKAPITRFGNLLFAGLFFSVINAVLEELIFRGILWESILDEWNQGTALIATSVLFGIGHLQGYPPGPIGAIMAGLYGVMLGVLRWRTRGLGLGIACHVLADATIFGILAATLE